MLNDRLVRAAKPAERYYDVSDDGSPLWLRVLPDGGKNWIWRGRVGGKTTKRVIGTYPEMTLSQARLTSLTLKAEARQGTVAPVVPVTVRKTGLTVNDAWQKYMAAEGALRRTASEKEAMYRRDVAPAFGERLLKDVTKSDIRSLIIGKFETSPVASNRLLALVKRFLNWSVDFDLLDSNPATTVRKLVNESTIVRQRVLTMDENAYLMLALREGAAREYGPVVTLLLYTFLRLGSVTDLTWAEVNQSDHRLEIGRTKNGSPFSVLLAPEAWAMLPARPEGAMSHEKVFTKLPASTRSDVERLRQRTIAIAAEHGHTMPHFRIHDLNKNITNLGRLRDADGKMLVAKEVRKALKNHKPANVTDVHYDFYDYAPERDEALLAWAEQLNQALTKVCMDAQKSGS